MTPPNVIPSPKAQFQAIKQCVDQHRELIQRPDFMLAVEKAMAQMLWVQSGGGDSAMSVLGNVAAERFYRLQGAQEFVRTLRTLAEPPPVLPAQDTGDISHEFK